MEEALPGSRVFHHIGYATKSVTLERKLFESLGYAQDGATFEDPIQGVKGCFIQGPGPRIELLENLEGSQTLTPWLNSGIKMYHIAYQVEYMDEAIAWAKNLRGKMIIAPVSATAFCGKKICFFSFRQGPMLEFIEL
jgi:methylmalonyl-CoA/ethylmalonyl-CoA epimerase